MIVDWVRSFYSSRFRVNAVTGESVRGRFYRANPLAEVATDAYAFRSAGWLEEWERSDGVGDTFEDYAWEDGTQGPKGTCEDVRAIAARCPKRVPNDLAVSVDGRGGLPPCCFVFPRVSSYVPFSISFGYESPDGVPGYFGWEGRLSLITEGAVTYGGTYDSDDLSRTVFCSILFSGPNPTGYYIRMHVPIDGYGDFPIEFTAKPFARSDPVTGQGGFTFFDEPPTLPAGYKFTGWMNVGESNFVFNPTALPIMGPSVVQLKTTKRKV